MFVISTLSSPSFTLTVINRMMETHREKYYANYSPTWKCPLSLSLFVSFSPLPVWKFLSRLSASNAKVSGMEGEIFGVRLFSVSRQSKTCSFLKLPLSAFPSVLSQPLSSSPWSFCLTLLCTSLHLSVARSSSLFSSSPLSSFFDSTENNKELLPVLRNLIKLIKLNHCNRIQ